MKSYLSFQRIYKDEDLLELFIEASNGKYSGATKIYIESDGEKLITLGENLKGFPKDIRSQFIIELGVTEKDKQLQRHIKFNHAYLRIIFGCIDKAGHTTAQIKIREDSWIQRESALGEAYFELLFEPSQVDFFADELVNLGLGKIDTAVLNCLDYSS
ncbi:MAG: hypothetical protein C0410_06500 [Anaerolinea sp.]|nr:hypothetical protein [Anaerolinea sp.]